MRVIQTIIGLIFLIWLLIIAWPLFLILVVILIVSWTRFIRKVKVIQKDAFENQTVNRPPVDSDDIIDAEYTESEVKDK